MEPRIVQKERMLLVGLDFFGDPFQLSSGWTEENEIGRLWARLIQYMKEKELQIPLPEQMFEVHIEHFDTRVKGHFEVFVGFEIEKADLAPVDLVLKVLPANTFAIYTLKGKEISSDWETLLVQEWLSKSGYEIADPFNYQLYDERFKGMDRLHESEIDLYIPICKKKA